MKKYYKLSLICEYNNEVEVHTLHIGALSVCRAIQILSKQKQKQYIKNGTFPKDAKITYKIEKEGIKI